jgi:hypothetical protein
MEAQPLDKEFAFPDLATRSLQEDEIRSDTLDFPTTGEEPLGVFRGLLAAAIIQIGFVLLIVLGWQLWRFFL